MFQLKVRSYGICPSPERKKELIPFATAWMELEEGDLKEEGRERERQRRREPQHSGRGSPGEQLLWEIVSLSVCPSCYSEEKPASSWSTGLPQLRSASIYIATDCQLPPATIFLPSNGSCVPGRLISWYFLPKWLDQTWTWLLFMGQGKSCVLRPARLVYCLWPIYIGSGVCFGAL